MEFPYAGSPTNRKLLCPREYIRWWSISTVWRTKNRVFSTMTVGRTMAKRVEVIYSTITIKVNVSAASIQPCQGWLYSIYNLVVPLLRALNVYLSIPPVPTGAPVSGALYSLFTFSITLLSEISITSHWKPVVILESKSTLNSLSTLSLTASPESELSTRT